MHSTIELLRNRVRSAVSNSTGIPEREVNPLLARSQDDRFGDYQSNCAMGLAKKLGARPGDVAQKVVDELVRQGIDEFCEPLEIAAPGFINFRLKTAFVARELAAIPPSEPGAQATGQDASSPWTSGPVLTHGVLNDRLGIQAVAHPTVVVVDLSSPNLAKEMHVGHLRSTVIGDCVARLMEFAGHRVHRINHVGDWGTQFGMLLAHLRRTRPEVLDKPDQLILDDLEKFYVEAKSQYDADPAFAESSRKTVVELQRQDPAVMAVWRAFCDESLRHCHEIYDRLGITVTDQGESYYRDMLGDIVRRFEEAGLAELSEGALCVFPDRERFKTRDGDPLPMIIRKSDGAYNYDTTDLAAVWYRIEKLGARRLIYVVGVPQKQHFEMLFAAARKIGWGGDGVMLDHLAFGNMLGADGRPFKTRTGGTVKLKDLLNEANDRARRVVEQSVERASLDEATVADIADAVSIGSISYYDLSHSLSSDYKFDWDTILSLDGNTAPYMLYAYARVRSIGRKAGVDFNAMPGGAGIILEHESEIRLARALLRLAEVIELATADLRPNILTDYLFELSKAFSLFYDRRHGVRVIDAETDALRLSRLRLCDLTARSLRLGLQLLGIRTVEQM